LPLNPVHRATVGVDYDGLSWRAGADLRAQSEEFLNGDESNQEPELSGRVTVDIHGAVSITENLELFAGIDNFFDAHYESSGAFTDLENLPPNFALTDPRSVVPAPSRQFFIGLRVHA
jgi:iron complex outermembrane receptor protein